jgi:alpha-D-ribose 1-methylphosphonate 5-triphosphate synthase subunit PhnI
MHLNVKNSGLKCLREGVDPLIEIRFDGPEAQTELASFYDWLQREDDVRRKAEISLAEAVPSHGDMGSGWEEAVQLVLDYGFQGASLALAYATWRGSRVLHKFQVTLTTGGTSVTIDADDPEVAAKIAGIVAKDLENG